MTAGTTAPNGTQHAKVFISYSRRDMTFVDRLEAALKARQFEPLIDREEIYAFEDWWKRIEDLIARADTIVFVLTPNSVASEVARKEVSFAESLSKRFAPIVFRTVDDKAVPEALAKLNYVFFNDETRFEESADQLADALNTDIVWVRQHTEFSELARRWSRANRPIDLLLRSPVLEQAERWIASRPPGAPAPMQETIAFISRSRQDATRRRNVLTGSLAAGLVVAMGLAGLAYWQRGIAVEERDRATRNFKLAQQTAESLVFDLAQGLRNVQGMQAEAVRKILETSRGTFEQLAASAPDDPTLQRSRGVMFGEFGSTYLSLGDLDQAMKVYSESLAIAERMAAADPRTMLWQHDLSAAYVNVGDVLVAKGNLDDALRTYGRGRDIAERLVVADPGNMEWQRDLAVGHNNVGNVKVAQGLLNEALASYRAGIVIAERLASTEPTNTRWQRDLSVSYRKVGDVLKTQGQLADALKAFQDGLAIRERLAASDRTNTQWQRDLSVSYDTVGGVLMAQDRIDEALASYRNGLAIAERLAAADPGNKGWQRDLAIGYHNIGDIMVAQRRADEALKPYRDGLAIAERLAAADPGNAQWQRDLWVTHFKVGDVLSTQGKLNDSLKSYRDGLAIAERLAAGDRSNTQLQADLLVGTSKLGNLAYKFLLTRAFTTALESADQAIALAPNFIWFQAFRSHTLMFLGRAEEARAVYLRFRGQQRVNGEKSWEAVIMADFAVIRQAGLTHPLMDEIDRLFTSRN